MLKTFISAGAASALALAAGTAIAQTAPATTAHQGHRAPATTTAPASTEPTVTEAPATTAATTPATDATTPPADASTPPAQADAATAAPATAAGGTIAAAVAANADLSTLEGALTAADVASTLAQPGPFTVFAPTNEAFNLIAANTRAALMDPANRQALATILKFHVVQGNLTTAALRQQIQAGGGTAHLQTVAGQELTSTLEGNNIVLTGQNNSKAYITSADNAQSNGTVHVVNGILVPQLG